MTTSTSASAHAAASAATLPLPMKVAAIGLGPLLQHPQDDACAGGVGQTGELVERMIRVAARRGVDEADERGALERG